MILHRICSTGFRLVDEDGNDVSAGERGLLLYNEGTVCDDEFSEQSANAICLKLGYPGPSDWRSGYYFEASQLRYDIKLDDVSCRDSVWKNCTFSTRHNCDHSEDIFLVCNGKRGLKIMVMHFCSFNLRFPST